jgi:hypothetical protein
MKNAAGRIGRFSALSLPSKPRVAVRFYLQMAPMAADKCEIGGWQERHRIEYDTYVFIA